MDTRTSETRLRIERLRDALTAEGAHAVLVPSSDPHLSEYLPGRWQGREWLSGFTGSMGSLVVTRDRAALFADSRYWDQAEAQLAGSGIQLEKLTSGASTQYIDWLAKELQTGQVLAVDGQVLGLALANALRAGLGRKGITLRTDVDLLQRAWDDRPALPTEPIYEHLPPQAAVSRADKLARVRTAMATVGATHHLVSTVDDVAWLLNLRGSDVECNPVFIAHLLLDAHAGRLFIGDAKVPAELAARLAADGLQLAPYDQAAAALAALPAEATLLKSRKTADEAVFIRAAMAEDGAAMCEFYAEFEASLARGERWSELDVDTRLSAQRSRRQGFVGLSFATIAGWMANGAQPHYRATPESFAWIEGDGLLLIDSGGQYLGGTTDITRVWPIGSVSAAQKRDYTLVLKCTLALSRTRFPRGTLSPMLDAIARAPLWAHGLDYGHGTGHGVGYFLNVHEGPQSISKAIPEPTMAMERGMITSIEPGLYRPGLWGVRIENLVMNVAVETPENNAFGEMLEFETLTLCPIDTRCIDMSLMRADEIAWLNGYHATVRERLRPLVSGPALAWLLARTEPLAS